MSSNVVVAAETWLYQTLFNDPTLTGLFAGRICFHTVTEGIAFPLVYVTAVSWPDNVMTLNGDLIFSTPRYCVRAVDHTEDYGDLVPGAAAIYNALQKKNGSNVFGSVLACINESPFQMQELGKDGYEIRHLGGLYGLQVQ
jgi:hypothetical protein